MAEGPRGSSIFECSALLPSGRQLLADPMSLLLESNEERAIGHYEQWLKQATFGGREGDTSPHHDMVMLHRIVHALANSSSLITLETGFANGGSTVAILAAHDAHGTHVSDGRLRGGFDCEEVASRWRGGGEQGSTEAARWQ